LNVKALALTVALLWGGAVFLVGLAHMVWPGYGGAFLELCASIYPGYTVSGSFASVIVGALYALLDGGIGGLIFGWLYNLIAEKFS
jgi:hypothetical protein